MQSGSCARPHTHTNTHKRTKHALTHIHTRALVRRFPETHQPTHPPTRQVFIFYALKEVLAILGSITKWNVNNEFGLTLKNAVFKNILRQDIEFFDKKQVGAAGQSRGAIQLSSARSPARQRTRDSE